MDSHQAIYDAVRSKISNGDVGNAIETAIRDMNLSHYVDQAAEAIKQAAYDYQRPSAMYRPKIYIHGNKWCALYGENLQDGVAGFGDSPFLAMCDFDNEWIKKLPEKCPLKS